MKHHRQYLAFLSLLLAFSGCSEPAFYETNTRIADRKWSYADVPKFEVHITDAQSRYDISVNVRHSAAYKYSNIFFLLHEKGPGIKDTAYRHEMKLAELDGRWLGRSAGNLYENQLLLKENYAFPDTGLYQFGVEQNMRENPLLDITDVGLKLIKKP